MLRYPKLRPHERSVLVVQVGGGELVRGGAGWKTTYRDDAPNAALQLVRAPHSRDAIIVELRDPKRLPGSGLGSFAVTPPCGSAG
jgi:hypothetical protein